MRSLALAALLALAACQPPAVAAPSPVAPLSPLTASRSSFMVEVTVQANAGSDASETVYWSGTAWVARTVGGKSQLITAGHVCASGTLELDGQNYPVTSATYSLIGRDGWVTTAEMVKRSDDPDLCLLQADADIGPGMPVSPVDPYYDEPVAYVGAPLGVFGDGMAPLYRGFYAGGNLIAIPTAPGASGSGVFTSDGVIGVLVQVARGFPNETFIEPRNHLVDFLK